MKKSRKIFFHDDCNASKIIDLEALPSVYGEYFCCKGCGKKGHADNNATINLTKRFGDNQINGKLSEVKKYFRKQYVVFRNIIESFGDNSIKSSKASNLILTDSFHEEKNPVSKAEGSYI